MKALAKFLKLLYSWITVFAIGIGLVVAALFLISLIIGGSTATSLAVTAGTLMNWAIRLATVAVLFGAIYIYMSKEHSLTMDKRSDNGSEGTDNIGKHVG